MELLGSGGIGAEETSVMKLHPCVRPCGHEPSPPASLKDPLSQSNPVSHGAEGRSLSCCHSLVSACVCLGVV